MGMSDHDAKWITSCAGALHSSSHWLQRAACTQRSTVVQLGMLACVVLAGVVIAL